MLRLFWRAVKNNVRASLANPLDFGLGVGAMMLNNVLFFGTVGFILFGPGGPGDASGLRYYLSMQAAVFFAWGATCFFLGGFRELGAIIESGEFDAYLAQPRSPLLLAGLSRSMIHEAGDLVMGMALWGGLTWAYGPVFGLKVVAASVLSFLGCLCLMILAAAASLLIPRGSSLSELVIHAVLIASGWPLGPKLRGWERWALLLTPYGLLVLWPMEALFAVEGAAWMASVGVAFLGLAVSVFLFRLGLRNYQGNSLVQLR
jgi:ABC-type uncharacterized transport system permease subunit